MRQRTTEIERSPYNGGTKSCAWNGCGKTTREGKPFCSDHVEQHGYVQEILEILAEKEAEEERVRQHGSDAVDPEGLNARELLLHLDQHGSRTIERLAREFQLESNVISGYVEALASRGRVVTGRTTRGSVVVQPTGHRPAHRAG